MRTNLPLAAAAVLIPLLAGQGAAAQDKPGRYTMTPADGGFIRLDTETGQMSHCKGKEGSWTCSVMPDDAQALRKENERLAAEVKALKEEVQRLEALLGFADKKPDGTPATPDAPGAPGGPRGEFKLPSEQDVDKAFDYMERMIKKFRDRFRDLERDERKDGPDKKTGTPL